MRVIIIEDEKLSADHLVHLLQKMDPALVVAGRFETVKQSIQAFEKGVEADLMFVDI